MMTVYAKKTKSVVMNQDYYNYRLNAKAEIHAFTDEAPYFSVTGDITMKNGRDSGGGCCHDLINRYCRFSIGKFTKWHLFSTDKGPMHGVANAIYFAGHSKWLEVANLEHLKSTIVYGAVDGDLDFNLEAHMAGGTEEEDEARKAALTAWLTNRIPALQKAFHADMIECFGEDAKDGAKPATAKQLLARMLIDESLWLRTDPKPEAVSA